VIGIVGVTTDVTDRRAAEERQAVLLDLLERLRSGEPAQSAVAHVLGTALSVKRAGYAIADADGEHLAETDGWFAGRPHVTARYRLRDYGPAIEAALRSGETLVVDDIAADPRTAGARQFDAIAVRAAITVPVVRGGRLVAAVYVNDDEPRAWRPDEVALVHAIAERAWEAMERERAVVELAAAEDRLRLATEAAEIGFWDVDPINETLFWPARVKAMFGISASVPVSMDDYYAGVHPDDQPHTFAAYETATDPAVRGVYDVEYRTVGKEDGVVRWVAAKGRGVFDAQGRCVRVLGTAIDITARKAVEEELRQLNATLAERVRDAVTSREEALAQLHEAQKLETLGQLTGGVAHDFNNLLQPVIGGLDLLRRRTDDARAEKLIDGALQSAERAKTLVQRLLAFARRQQLRPVATDVAGLVHGMRELIERSLGPRIAVEIAADPGLPPALVDPNQLELALLNLAVNGRDAMPDGGALRLEVALDAAGGPEPGPYLRVAVRDTGSGMDATTLARAVEPFFSTKEVGRGTGLGLSMVHGLAAQSGGAFRLASAPGEGTTATLWLPVANGPPQSVAPRAEAPRAQAPARLLLVDDNPAVRASTSAALAELGYAVTEAETGAAGVAALERERFDLVVTDYLMPGMSGAEVARLAARHGVPALIITGYATLSEDEVRGLDVLPKPFSLAELGARVAAPLAARG
jgi:PAS domain S-box-containing protein